MLLYQYFGVIIISNTFLANKIFSEIENENNEKNNVTFNAVVKIISKMVVTDIHEINFVKTDPRTKYITLGEILI